MKKILIALLASSLFVTAVAQTIYAKAPSTRSETVVTSTNVVTYLGIYITDSRTNSIANESERAWKIIRTTYTTNYVFLKAENAYGTAKTGDLVLWATAWTNRVNATYK